MKTALECIPCFVNQSLVAANQLALSDKKTESLLREMLSFLSEREWHLPPPVIAREAQRLIRKHTDCVDPYYEQKLTDTQTALRLLSEIETAVSSAQWPFLTAVQFSIAGNAIDFGAARGWDASVGNSFQNALLSPLNREAVSRLEEMIRAADNVLFLADNCGEIVFDRPLLELIGPGKVTVAVRGEPVLNDATLDDARRSGLMEKFRVISNGSDVPGTWVEACSPDFRNRFDRADLIIAKGQGNYESLSDSSRNICFLFIVKCPFVAGQVGVPTGTHSVFFTR